MHLLDRERCWLYRVLPHNLHALAGRKVLEMGCGGNPLVAFAALRHCRMAVACDGSPKALELMERNVCANAR